jgi:SAM-dependent methyltransferase
MFEVADFDHWANSNSANPNLSAQEAYLVTRFFDKDTATLEGGTGGGRVTLALRDAGFTDLYAFDFVPGSIVQARDRDPGDAIHFDIMDARDLQYAADTFGQLVYPSAMICDLESAALRQQAIREAQRVLKPGGIAIMTALSFEVATQSKVRAAFIRYLTMLRFLRRANRPPGDLPWLRVRRRINWSALADLGPYLHYYTIAEFAHDLMQSGLSVEALATGWQIEQDHLCSSVDELAAEPLAEILYAVCRKPR